MGFSIALVACATKDAPSVIAAMGLTETQTPDTYNEKPLSGVVSGGHYLIWRNWRLFPASAYDYDYKALSKTAPFMVLDIDETTMTSAIQGFAGGKLAWGVFAFEGDGAALDSKGDLPFDLDAVIAADAEKRVRSNEGQAIQVEPGIFGIPVEAFIQLTGFQYDSLHALPFVELQGVAGNAKPAGWFGRLFGKRL